VAALNIIHFTNKRRAEELAVAALHGLEQEQRTAGRLEVHFIPVSFRQLSPYDPHRIPDPNGLFQRVRQIPTTYGLSLSDDFLIAQAGDVLLSAEQQVGWKVGPRCAGAAEDAMVRRADEAFVFALLRKDHWGDKMWEEDASGEMFGEWCKSR